MFRLFESILILSLVLWGFVPSAQAQSIPGLVKDLAALRAANEKELGAVESSLQKILKNSVHATAEMLSDPQVQKGLDSILEQIRTLADQREEFLARQRFLEKLFQIATAKLAPGADLKKSLWPLLLEWARNELALQTPDRSEPEMATFLVFLSIAVREVPEPAERLGPFIGEYLNYSSVLNPKSPVEFAKKYDYIGGLNKVSGRKQAPQDEDEEFEAEIKSGSSAQPQ